LKKLCYRVRTLYYVIICFILAPTGSQNNFKIPNKREKRFRKNFEKMEGFSFVTPVTGLNRLNTGKEDDDNYDDVLYYMITMNVYYISQSINDLSESLWWARTVFGLLWFASLHSF
jgi:hypothetical protein